MAEPKDAVMPVLRKIQDELAAIRKDNKAMRSRVDGISDAIGDLNDKFDDLDVRMTYHLGLTSQHKHDFKTINAKIKSLASRVSTLESKS
jgi:outer membrane murein-binding lipoprotein Lpp